MTRPLPWLLIAIGLAMPAIVLAEPIACPTMLSGAGVIEAPAGWRALPPASVRLVGGGLMRGDPGRQAYLRGNDKRTPGGSTSISEFEAGEEKWLWCGYGRGEIQIAKRLPDAATVCTVTHKEIKGEGVTSLQAVCR
jgi:hypothetical protein